MTTVISGSSPSITFSDATTQTTAFTSTPSVTSITTSADSTIHGITVGLGAGSVSTNTAVGTSALASNSGGALSVAVGYQALSTMANDYYNVAVGYQALKVTNLATNNTGVGALTLVTNSSGASNTAIGSQALKTNSTGGNNTALGYQAGYSMDTNGVSTYIGNQAGYLTTGYGNTFIGANSSVGGGSGGDMTTGNNNTIIGGFRGNSGGLDIRTSSNRIVLSDGAGNPRTYINDSGDVYFSTYTAGISAGSNQGTNSTYTLFTGYYLTTAPSGTGTICYKVTTNGNVYNTNNSYGSISDIKLKENIVNTSPKLDDLMNVRIVNYNLKEGQTHKQIGVIAQELEQIFPSMIEESQDFDKDGNDLGTTTKGVKYSVFVPMLIKALQELNAKFDAYVASHP
jgi:hypothetical protein